MKKLGLLTIILLLTFTICSFAQSTLLVWTKPTGGKTYQLFSIKQPNGDYIGICRGSYQGGVYPGKLVNKKCNIGYGGKEIVLSDFEVFEMDANPNIKINDSWRGTQFQVGFESNGQKVFLCYAVHQNTYQPGKSVDGKCFFTLNGTEIQATSFLQYFYETKSSTQTTTNPKPTPTPIPTFRPSNTQPVYQPKTTQPVYNPATVSTTSANSTNSVSKEIVTSVSQITDVKPNDTFYGALQSLIERYGVAGLTQNYKFNPNRNLTPTEFTSLANNGLSILKEIAVRNFIPERKFADLFGIGCNLYAVSVNPIPETDAANSLKCLYGLENFWVNSSQQPITRGKFIELLNQALDEGISRISGFTTKENVKNDIINRINALFSANKVNEIIALINQLEAKKYDFGDSKIQAELSVDYFKYEPKAIAEVKLRQLSAADNTYQTLFYAYFYDIDFQIGEGIKFKQAGNQSAARKAFQTASEKINLVKSVTQNRQELYRKEGLSKQLKPIYRAEKIVELEKLLKEQDL